MRNNFLEEATKCVIYFVVMLALIFAQGYLYNKAAGDSVWYAVGYVIIVILLIIVMILMIAAWDNINNDEGHPYG